MGARVGELCYGDQSQALDAYYLVVPPTVTAGSTSYLGWFEKVAGAWVYRVKTVSSSSVSVSEVPAPVVTFPDCNPLEPFTDGMQLGWLVAGLMVSAWGWLHIRRAAR